MKMSSLVDSTHRALVRRLQRAGTGTRPVSRPTSVVYRWSFEVFAPDDPKKTAIKVEVGIHTKNVYKNDKVAITVSGLVANPDFKSFVPDLGNCPPLDAVEAFVRKALAEKVALPEQPSSKKETAPPPPPPPPVEEISPPAQVETSVEPSRRKRGRRHEAEPESVTPE